jgi:uncharacterized protein YbdZ (MbtH family)
MRDDARYQVLRNDEDQYSLWLASHDAPTGWSRVGKEGTKEECSAYVDKVWTDMRPRSLRESSVELRTTAEKGEGVFATRWFDAGETVIVGVIERRLDRNNSHAIQIGPDEFVEVRGLRARVNHSCNPNCGIRVNGSGAPDVVARERIAPGTEITYDYAMENYVVEHFAAPCCCGEKGCRGTVTGWRDLPAETKAAYRGFVSPYLLDMDRQGVFASPAGPPSPAFSDEVSGAVAP